MERPSRFRGPLGRGGKKGVARTPRIVRGRKEAEEICRAIERIPGVSSAALTLSPQGEILEVHLVGPPGRSPKRIVRDVESLLCAQFRVRIDYRKISLVQPRPEDALPASKRLRFISAMPRPGGPEVQVILQTAKGRFEGMARAERKDGERGRALAAASATLQAVEKALGQAVVLKVDELQIVPAEDRQVCLAVVSVATAKGREQLSGTCIVNGDLLASASKAALDAINRRLPVWSMDEEGGEEKGALSRMVHV